MRPVVVLLLALAAAAGAAPPPEVVALQKHVRQMVDAAEPSVACVLVSRSEQYANFGQGPSAADEGRLGDFRPPPAARFVDVARRDLVKRLDLSDRDTVPEAYGSGIVIDEAGLVLTNYHVIEKATKVYVRLPGPGRGSYADVAAADARADLAVLRMLRPPADLKPLPFGDGGTVRKGDLVVSLANPFAAGFRDGSPSVGWGMIANVRLRAPGPRDEIKRARPLAEYGTLLQTDVRLNLGSSGGALIDLDGRVVGMTTALAAITGGETAGGYAIPFDANTKKMIEVLKRGEEIEYGFLGVTVASDDRGNGAGVIIQDVAAGLPAARAGLMARDVVVAINGNPVREQDDLFLNISAALAGTEAKIQVLRNGRPLTVTARLAKSLTPADMPAVVSNRPRPVHGLRVDYASTLPIDANPAEGVLVKELEAGSPAATKLKPWADRATLIVTAVDGQPVPTPADFYRLAGGKRSVTLDVVEASRDAASTRQRVTLP